MNARAYKGGAHRGALLAKVHIAKKQLGLDDDLWRDLVEQLFGTRSVAKLTPHQLTTFVEELKLRGFQDKPKSVRDSGIANPLDVPRETINGPNAGAVAKLRALWLSLYHLGVVEDPKDSAIEAFVQRQTKASNAGAGVTKLKWLPQGEAYRAIEALKDWATREGVNWGASKDPRDCILLAMTDKCLALGIFQYERQMGGLSFSYFGSSEWRGLAAPEKDRFIQILGTDIRARKGHTS